MFGSPLSAGRRSLIAAAFGVMLTVSACGSDAPAVPTTSAVGTTAAASSAVASSSGSAMVEPDPVESSTAATSTPVTSAPATSSPATAEDTTGPTGESAETEASVPPVTDRPAAEQDVAEWVAGEIATTTGEDIDPTCVLGFVVQLSDDDLALMANAVTSDNGLPPNLSDEGNLIGDGLTACIPSMNPSASASGGPTGDDETSDSETFSAALDADRAVNEADALVYVESVFASSGNPSDEECVKTVIAEFSDEDLEVLAASTPGDALPTLSAEGTTLSNSFAACVVSTETTS